MNLLRRRPVGCPRPILIMQSNEMKSQQRESYQNRLTKRNSDKSLPSGFIYKPLKNTRLRKIHRKCLLTGEAAFTGSYKAGFQSPHSSSKCPTLSMKGPFCGDKSQPWQTSRRAKGKGVCSPPTPFTWLLPQEPDTAW